MTKRKRTGYVIIRHTRAGEVFCGWYEERDPSNVIPGCEQTRTSVMRRARCIVEEAARNYDAVASVSVFRATLTLTGRPLRPRNGER